MELCWFVRVVHYAILCIFYSILVFDHRESQNQLPATILNPGPSGPLSFLLLDSPPIRGCPTQTLCISHVVIRPLLEPLHMLPCAIPCCDICNSDESMMICDEQSNYRRSTTTTARRDVSTSDVRAMASRFERVETYST